MDWQGKKSKNRGKGGAGRADWRNDAAKPTDWRDGPQQDASAPSPTSTAFFSRDWLKANRYRKEDRQFKRRLALVGAGLLAVAIFAIFVWVISYRPKATPIQVLSVSIHENDVHRLLAPNGFALEDALYFEAAFAKTNDVRVSMWGEKDEDRSRLTRGELIGQLRGWIDSAKPGGPDQVMILYLSCHGLVDDQGAPCVITSDADPTAPEKWLRLKTIFDTIQANKDLEGTRKLILLDCTRIHALWSLGVLYNDFYDAVERLLTAPEGESKGTGYAYKDLVVINSTGPGEVGLTDPRRGVSLFGYYCVRGLAGEADAAGDDADGAVSLQELLGYLRREVSGWARRERNTSQTPTLIHGDLKSDGDVDFRLVQFNQVLVEKESEQRQARYAKKAREAAEKLARDCDKDWGEFDKLRKGRAYSYAPLRWARIEHKLLRLESYVLAGKAYKKRFEGLRLTVGEDMAEIAKARRAVEFPVVQLADLGNEDLRRGLEVLQRWRDAERSAGDPAKKPDTAGGDESAAPRLSYRVRAAAVWKTAADAEGESAEFDALFRFLDQPPPPPALEPTEIHLMRMLDRWVTAPAARETIPMALECFDYAQRAATVEEPRAHYWVKKMIAPLDERRRQLEDELVAADDSGAGSEGQAAGLFQRFRELAGVAENTDGPSYAAAVEKHKKVVAAFRIRNDALARSPWLALWICSQLHIVERGSPEWQRAVERYMEFGDLRTAFGQLGRALDNVWSDDEIDKVVLHAGDVERYLKRLTEACEGSVASWSGQKNAKLNQIALLLDTPLLLRQNRARLRKEFIAVVFEKPVQGEREGVPAPVSDDAYLKRIASDTNPIATITDTNELELPGAAESSEEPLPSPAADAQRRVLLVYVRQLGAEVRRRHRRLVDQANDLTSLFDRYLRRQDQEETVASVRDFLSKADRLVRARATFAPDQNWARFESNRLPGARPSSAGRDSWENKTPALYLRRVDYFFYLLWQCERVTRDAWGPSPRKQRAYFEEIAKCLLDEATRQCPDAAVFTRPAKRLLEGRATALSRDRDSRSELAIDRVKGDDTVDLAYKAVLAFPESARSGKAALFVGEVPAGRPFLLRTEDGVDIRRIGVDVDGTASREVSFSLSEETARASGTQFPVNLLYRFHHRQARGDIIWSDAGDVICYRPPSLQAPTVEVEGESAGKTWLIFVLDCSGSMAPSREDPADRLASAKLALHRILAEMQNSNPLVGILCYGHRARLTRPMPCGIAMRPPGGGAPRKLAPGFVGEVIDPRTDHDWLRDPEGNVAISASKLTPGLVRSIDNALSNLKATGQTPLYLSMMTALNKFKLGQAGVENLRLVVITDGVDNPGWDLPLEPFARELVKNQRATSLADVEELLRREQKLKGVKIDVLYIGGKSALNAKFLPRFEQLQRFADQPKRNRRFRQVNRLENLMTELKEAVGAASYRVVCTDNRLQESEAAIPFGKVWTTRHQGPDEGNYRVEVLGPRDERLARTDLRLSDGERIWLRFAGDALEHRRYEERLYMPTQPIKDPTNLSRTFIVVDHLPEPDANRRGELITLSIQNGNEKKFSPRPRQMWVEVRPIRDDGSKVEPPFVFRDLSFKQGTPVPVIDLLVPNWPVPRVPGRSRLADVRFWFTFADFDRRDAIWSKNVRDAVKGALFQLPTRDQVKLRVRERRAEKGRGGYAIEVTVLHSRAETMRTFMVHVDRDPELLEIRRSYNDDAHQVRHTFWYRKRPVGPPLIIDVAPVDRFKDRRDAISGTLEIVLPK